MRNLDILIKDKLNESIDELMAYHGTMHDFDRFDTAYLGTGTGQQDYGWGIYLSDNPSVAQSYGNIVYEVDIPDDKNKYIYADKFYGKTFCMKLLRKIYKRALQDPEGIWAGSEQELFNELSYTFQDGMYGEQIMGTIEGYISTQGDEQRSDEASAKFLYSMGFYGYKYKDGNITNIVMFNSDDIHIIKKIK